MRNLFTLLFAGLILISCNQKPKTYYLSFGGFTQGTTYNITYESLDSIDYQNKIENLLAEFDSSLSTYNRLSLISKINYNESNITDEYIRTVINKASEVYKNTDCELDITVAPLVNPC